MKPSESWINTESMPPAVAQALQRVVNRTRRIVALRGVCASLGIALAGFFLVMALDARLVFMNAWPRWVLSGCAWGITAAAALWFLYRPLRRGFTLSGMARVIEQKHPELQERLSSIVELSATGDAGEVRGSETLIQALAEQAIRDVDGVHPSDAASLRAIRPWLVGALSLLAILALLLAVRPRETAVLLGRAAFPMANLSNLSALDLEVDPGDARVGEGRPLTLTVKAKGRRGQEAMLYITPAASGRETAVPMNRTDAGPDGRVPWTARFDSVQGDFRYRVRVDRAVSRFYDIQSVPPPVIRSVALQYRFPAYAGMPDAQAEDQGGAIHALDHTRVKLLATVNKPIARPELMIKCATPMVLTGQVEKATADGVVLGFEFTLAPGLNGLAVLTLTDEYGFVNPPWERTVQAIPDQKPVLKVLFPDKPSLRLSRLDRIPMVAAAADDLGVTRVEWRMDPSPQPAIIYPIVPGPVSNRPPVTFHSSTNLLLANPGFLGVPQVMLTFRASDNRAVECGGSQWVSSVPISLVFDEAAPSVDEQAFAAQEAFIKAQLETAQKELTTGRDQIKPLGNQFDKPETGKPALQRIDEANKHVEEAARKLGLLADGARNGYMDKVGREAGEIANQTLAEASQALEQVPHQADAAAKSAVVTQALDRVQTALDQVSALSSNFLAAAAAVKQALILKDLEARTEILSGEAPTNAVAMAEVMRERKRAAERLAEVMKTLPQGSVAQALEERLQGLAGKTEAIRKEQDALAEKVEAGENPDAAAEKAIQEVGAAQDQLARDAQNREATRPQAPAMQETGALLKRDELEAAMRNQERVVEELRNKAGDLREKIPVVEREAVERLAQAAAQDALKAAERADRAADTLDRLEDRLGMEAAKKTGEAKPDPRAEAMQALAGEAGLRKKEAEKLADQAARQAEIAVREADAVRQAPEPADREKTLDKAAAAAHEADTLADRAEKMADRVQEKAVAFQTAPERAQQAEARAVQAAREAKADAEQARELAVLASEEKLAKKLDQEAQKADRAAEQAAVAAETAKTEAGKVKDAAKPEEGAKAVELAEKAAVAGEKEAAIADQALEKVKAMLLAEPVVQARLEEPVREAQAAVKEAERSVKQAQEAVKGAKEAADQAAEKAPEAEEVKTWAEAAEHFGKATEEAAQGAREAAKKAADNKGTAAAEEAAQQAVEQARKADRAAQAATEFGDKAEEAAAAKKADPERAAFAAEKAEEAAEEAAQAARDAAEIAEARADEAVKPVLKALEEEARKAAQRSEQAAAQAAEQAKPKAGEADPAKAAEARKRAEEAAVVARGEAETAQALAEAARELARGETPAERAQTATKEAAEAAREAGQAEARAKQAAQQAEQAKQAAQKAAQQAQQAAAQPAAKGDPSKASEAAQAKAKAEEAVKDQARVAEAAQQAAQAAQQSRQAAQQAHQAAAESQRAAAPAAVEEKAVKAEMGAVEAVRQAATAERMARQAEQAVPATPQVRKEQVIMEAAQAAEESALQANEANQAAEAAKRAAEQAQGQAKTSERMAPMAGEAAQAAAAAAEMAKQAGERAKEAAQARDAARQSATPFAAEARAMEAKAKAEEAGRMAGEARQAAAEAQAAVQEQAAAGVEDLAGRQRELAGKTREAVEQMEKPAPELWKQASEQQEKTAGEMAGIKSDLGVARLMAEAVKKPEVAARLDRAMNQASAAEQAMKTADTAFDKASEAAEKAQATPVDSSVPASDRTAAAARQAAETASDQARQQAERTQAEVGKALAAAGQEAQEAAKTMAQAAAAAGKPEKGGDPALDKMAGQIPKAMSALQQAAADPEAAEAARDPLAQAAEAAEDRASALGGMPIANYPRLSMPSTGGGGGGGDGVADGESGYEAGLRLRNWFKLSGDISGTVMESAEDGEPDDYRGLIRRYFEEVSRRAHEE